MNKIHKQINFNHIQQSEVKRLASGSKVVDGGLKNAAAAAAAALPSLTGASAGGEY